MAIQFVGLATGTATGGTSYSVTVSTLTGGIASSMSPGDLVIVATAIGSNANEDPGVTSPTAIELADLYANDNNDANLSLSYFFAGGTPPTSITVNNGGAGMGGATVVMVFRGVDPTTPFDTAVTTATGVSSTSAKPPSITPVTTGAMIVVAGIVATATAGTMSTPTGFTAGGYAGATGSTAAASLRVSYLANQTGGVAINPSGMNCSQGGAGSSWNAWSAALRPFAGGNIKAWNGSAWVAKPVKYWNGSAWVTKPLKQWNGSAWVVTNY